MNKFKKNISAILFCMFILPLSCIDAVSAYTGGTGVFCPNNDQDVDTDYELWLSEETCEDIHDMLSNFGNNELNYLRTDYQVTYTTWGSILNAIENYCEYGTIFSKGHCVPWGDDNRPPYDTGDHFRLLDHNGYVGGAKDSSHILPYTSEQNNYFAFIWHCGTALSYPSYLDTDGYQGMPYAFTSYNGASYYGNTGDYVYLGWNWESPQFEYQIEWQYPDENWTYAHYAYLFFDYLCDGYSVITSLNIVSDDIAYRTFTQSDEYGELIIWGNKNLGLP